MVTTKQANDSINIFLHVVILMTFLTVLFFLYISKITERSVQKALSGIIKKEATKILDNLDKWSTKFEGKRFSINWKQVYDFAHDMVKNSQGKLPEIVANNNRLKKVSLGIAVGLFALWVLLVLYMMYYQKNDVHLGKIVRNNVILFGFIGIIEYMFFTKIAANYVPVTPDFVATSILERVKYNVSKALQE